VKKKYRFFRDNFYSQSSNILINKKIVILKIILI